MNGLRDENGNLVVIDETYDCSIDSLDMVNSSRIDSNDVKDEDPGLINFKDFSKTEFETIDFSKPETEFEYFSNSKAIETNIPLRLCIDKSDEFKKEMGSKSNDWIGISLSVIPNFQGLKKSQEALPETEYFSDSEINETDNFPGTRISLSSKSKKETRSESNDKVGISLSLIRGVSRSESNDKVKISPSRKTN